MRVKKDVRFERDGIHLHTIVPVTFPQAVFGATLTAPTLDGDAEIQVPAGTQPGDEVVLRGRGLPEVNGARTGDLVVHCKVVVPRSLSKEEEQLLRAFSAAGQSTIPVREQNGGEKSGFFRRKKK